MSASASGPAPRRASSEPAWASPWSTTGRSPCSSRSEPYANVPRCPLWGVLRDDRGDFPGLRAPGTGLYSPRNLFSHRTACRKVGERPPFFGSRTGTIGDRMDRELEQIQQTVEDRLHDQEPDVELLALERPASESLRLVIDSPEGVDLELCERVTGHLRDLLESYSLEVSSPGPERPLTKPEHFRRYLGRRVRVRTREEVAGHKSFTGRLTGADEESVSVDSGDGPVSIPLAAVRRSNLLPNVNGGLS